MGSSVPGSTGTLMRWASARAAVLSPIICQQFRARADEGDAGLGTGAGELGVLAQEAVTRVDGVHALVLRGGDDGLDIEVGRDRTLALADQIRFVRLEPVEAEAVLLRVDRHGAEAQLGARAENADGDPRSGSPP
jgi:hypothetical protein